MHLTRVTRATFEASKDTPFLLMSFSDGMCDLESQLIKRDFDDEIMVKDSDSDWVGHSEYNDWVNSTDENEVFLRFYSIDLELP